MSVTMSVFLSDEQMITPAGWAAAILSAGFEMNLDTGLDVRTFAGFLPCTYAGREAGFEYAWNTVDLSSLDDEVVGRIARRDIVVSFTTHADMRGLATSVTASAALCANTDGVLWDTESGELIAAAEALDWASEIERTLQADLSP
ncbi:hypothetical protein BH11MYX1_BH11MYX1_11370 [soil metagenome]